MNFRSTVEQRAAEFLALRQQQQQHAAASVSADRNQMREHAELVLLSLTMSSLSFSSCLWLVLYVSCCVCLSLVICRVLCVCISPSLCVWEGRPKRRDTKPKHYVIISYTYIHAYIDHKCDIYYIYATLVQATWQKLNIGMILRRPKPHTSTTWN
jgi:hypothetical protein